MNLLRAHGSPTLYLYRRGCRCASCCAANSEKTRRFRDARPDYRSTWDREHPDLAVEHQRRYKEAHPGRLAETYRRYRESHREQLQQYRAAYRPAHRDEAAAYRHNRRALEANATGTHTAADVRAQYERQKGLCIYCHEKVGDTYHTDHVMPLILGGSNGPENLVISCPTCNFRKGGSHPMDFAGVLL